MTYYVGGEVNQTDILGAGNPRFFYGLRREENGTLLFSKIDQLNSAESITLNGPGSPENNYEDFEYGVDYFDGRSAVDHSRPYNNFYFDQYRWDNKNCYYYINASGALVVRINQKYTYGPEQIL